MPIGAGLGISALVGAGASLYAANTQANAAKRGLGLEQQIYAQNSANLMPWIQNGVVADNSLAQIYGPNGVTPQGLEAFQNSPDYKFALMQGLKATDLGAAGRGGLRSGAGFKGEQEFGQGLATQQFGNYFSHLSDISKMGLQAAGNLAGLGGSMGPPMANMSVAQGQALGSGISGAANNFNGALSNYMFLQRLQNNGNGSSYGISSPMQNYYNPEQFQSLWNQSSPGSFTNANFGPGYSFDFGVGLPGFGGYGAAPY